MKKAPLVIISLLILVCLSGCGKKTVTETKSYVANEITELHINASSWNVALSAGSENAVDIDISGSISKGEEAPAISLSDGTLTILQVSEDSGKNEVALGKKGQITVTIPSELTVPIEINNGYGDMEINHISAPQFLLNNEAGYVNFTNFKADMLQISSTSGDIAISSSSIPDISVVSSSGYISLMQTEYLDCSLTAKSGEINIVDAVSHGNLSLQTGSGDISVTYQNEPDSLTFDVASGSEDLSVKFSSADYQIETSAHKQGVIGNGEYRLTLNSNHGTIVIK